ncbi:MAG: methyltransferase domain-containing protein [Gammaproteobacteria bacterium]|nr:methyltransferase domain-containing protein [Gammaproteobacteria bacterium]
MLENVRKYYGETLTGSEDLQTNACCTIETPPLYIRQILSEIHPEVTNRYYGCGLIVPEQLSGLNVLDLGCGAGRDCYLLSALVGVNGTVTGVDMTPQQLAIAKRHIDYHTRQFKYSKPNVRFLQGNLEALHLLDLDDASFDLIVSNCVINLCTDKAVVLRDAYRLLKAGGEMYFSDVYADRRIPESLAEDPDLYGECLSGAFYWNDFLTSAKQAGFLDPRLVKDRPVQIENPELAEKTGAIKFHSATYRLFKLDGLEPACEDYGQAVIYKGTIDQQPHEFKLDKHHILPAGKVFPVCGNTWRMLADTRFKDHFEFIGNWNTHYGIFKGCGLSVPFTTERTNTGTGCC